MTSEQQEPNINIEDISLDEPNHVANIPDEITKQENKNYGEQLKKLHVRSISQDIDERKKYANKIFNLIVWWLVGIGLLSILQGLGAVYGFFNLSEKVLLTIIGGTTINILGIFIIVANYLFPKFPK